MTQFQLKNAMGGLGENLKVGVRVKKKNQQKKLINNQLKLN